MSDYLIGNADDYIDSLYNEKYHEINHSFLEKQSIQITRVERTIPSPLSSPYKKPLSWKITVNFDSQKHLFYRHVKTGYVVDGYSCS